MNSARHILVGLICAVPTILLLDGPVIQGLVAAMLAGSIGIVAGTMRQGETDFLIAIIRPIVVLAAVPALWMLFQIAPARGIGLAHPIWQSAEQALGHPISGAISIDPGATLLALVRYLSAFAVMLVSAAIAVERERAEWVLFALVAATALTAIAMIGHDLVGLTFLRETAGSTTRAQARACVALGVIVSIAGGIRTFERHETGHDRPDRSPQVLMRTFFACTVALALCALALVSDLTAGLAFAVTYGIATLFAVVAIRRSGLGLWGCLAIAAVAAAIALVLIATRANIGSSDLTLAFASGKPDALLSTTQRILADAPWTGTGAGTFALLVPIYRDSSDMIASPAAPTTAATIAIELGGPMLWAIVIAVTVGIVVLVRGALQRGRDSFYPAAGASALLLLLLLAFSDNGLLGTPVAICAAAIAGLAFVQSKSRTIA